MTLEAGPEGLVRGAGAKSETKVHTVRKKNKSEALQQATRKTRSCAAQREKETTTARLTFSTPPYSSAETHHQHKAGHRAGKSNGIKQKTG